MHRKSQDSENKLFEIAESQQGYFTSKQAKASGYKDDLAPCLPPNLNRSSSS